jgi:putative transcriptional regulator
MVDDPVMGQAVCLIVHQDENQSIGVMLNRPIQPNPQALLQMLKSSDASTGKGNRLDSDGKPAKSDIAKSDTSETETDQPFAEQTDDDALTPIQSKDDDHSEAERTLAKATATLGTVHFGGPLNGPVVAVHSSSEFAEAETGSGIYVAAQKPNLEGLVRCQEAPYRLIVGHIGWDNQQLQAELDAGVWHTLPATTDAVFSVDSEMWPRLIRRATARSVASWIGTPDIPMAYEVN